MGLGGHQTRIGCTILVARVPQHARFRGSGLDPAGGASGAIEVMQNPFPPIDELASRLAAGLPEAMGSLRRDLENHFRAVLQGQLERLDLTSRTEFSVQSKVLERARTKVEQLEARVSALELRIRELETGKPTAA
jgi:hypothetical protein